MSGKPSVTANGKTERIKTITKMVEHLLETFKPNDGPCVIMWREFVNGFHDGDPNREKWRQDSEETHRHWKTYGLGVAKELSRLGLTVIKVNGDIRGLAKHGGRPERSGKRTDAAYRACLPNRNAPIRGMVLFPQKTQLDHPLILSSLDRRGRSASTGFENAVIAIDTANGRGVLSDGARDEILVPCKGIVHRVLEDKHPLFLNGQSESKQS